MDKILALAEKNNGIFSTTVAEAAGISRTELSQSVKTGGLVRLERGIYSLQGYADDELYQMQQHCRKGIYSHETALYLLGYTDRVPFQYTMTVPKGYHPVKVSGGFILIGTKPEFYDMGIVTAKTIYGHDVNTYSIEKTICDLLRGTYRTDIQEILPAFKKYMKSEKRDYLLLLKYAEELHVADTLRTWMEVYI
jgi:predicted transcriptional regulator of viral defense system